MLYTRINDLSLFWNQDRQPQIIQIFSSISRPWHLNKGKIAVYQNKVDTNGCHLCSYRKGELECT